jgi:hypothetical protein
MGCKFFPSLTTAPASSSFRFFEFVNLAKLNSLMRVNIIPFDGDHIPDLKILRAYIRILSVLLSLSHDVILMNLTPTSE